MRSNTPVRIAATCSMIVAGTLVLFAAACSGGGGASKATPTSASVSALESYFEQYCASAREVIRQQRAISTPVPGDADDVRRFVDANDQVLADWLRQQEQVIPPE